MGLYSKYIFPRLMNLGMSGETTARYRKFMLAYAAGEILEIGFGTGLNLPFYPEHVTSIHAVDINAGMKPLAAENISRSSIDVKHQTLSAENLPFPDNCFDTVVSTWTLCSIKDTQRALKEIYRVLKPAGKFIFAEHGLSNEPKIRKWQHRLTPIQKVIADGCHLDKNIELLIRQAGFDFQMLKKEYAEGISKLAGYLYYGVATRQPQKGQTAF
jgi:ubiquinone/menaquinone biosynthesis C-methylase UbiE